MRIVADSEQRNRSKRDRFRRTGYYGSAELFRSNNSATIRSRSNPHLLPLLGDHIEQVNMDGIQLEELN